MPFYFRKTVRAGPFRFNLSNSGVGVSVGVKGLRIGTGPRGHYIHAGRGGFYYRAALGRAHRAHISVNTSTSRPQTYVAQDGVVMTEIQSGDVAGMRDATVADLIEDLNRNQSKLPLGILAGCSFAVAGVLALLTQGSASEWSHFPLVRSSILLAAIPAWAVGEWFDSYRRTSVLLYKLESTSEASYRKFIEAFDALAACHGKWHIPSGAAVRDLTTWKRNAGAAHLVTRKSASLSYNLPKVLRSNVIPPEITLSNRVFFFLPDTLLIKQGGKFGAIGYDDLNIRTQTSRFIEDGSPPADAQVVDRTWKHPNKNGGPDRRFRDNRLLPVCLYEVMHLSSASGADELMEFSRTGIIQRFSTALHDLPHKQAPDSLNRLTSLVGSRGANEDSDYIGEKPATNRFSEWMLLGIVALATAIVATPGAVYILRQTAQNPPLIQKAAADSPPATALSKPSPPEPITQKQSSGSTQPTLSTMPIVWVRNSANVRNGPNLSAAVVRVAGSREKFNVFGRANGWVRVGFDKPIGWIAANLLAE